MNHSDEANTLPLPKEFATILGYFHAAFASLDLTTDFAIFKFLNTTPAEAHLITSPVQTITLFKFECRFVGFHS
jgi:hypothetical protein